MKKVIQSLFVTSFFFLLFFAIISQVNQGEVLRLVLLLNLVFVLAILREDKFGWPLIAKFLQFFLICIVLSAFFQIIWNYRVIASELSLTDWLMAHTLLVASGVGCALIFSDLLRLKNKELDAIKNLELAKDKEERKEREERSLEASRKFSNKLLKNVVLFFSLVIGLFAAQTATPLFAPQFEIKQEETTLAFFDFEKTQMVEELAGEVTVHYPVMPALPSYILDKKIFKDFWPEKAIPGLWKYEKDNKTQLMARQSSWNIRTVSTPAKFRTTPNRTIEDYIKINFGGFHRDLYDHNCELKGYRLVFNVTNIWDFPLYHVPVNITIRPKEDGLRGIRVWESKKNQESCYIVTGGWFNVEGKDSINEEYLESGFWETPVKLYARRVNFKPKETKQMDLFIERYSCP